MYKTAYKNHDSIEKQNCREKIIKCIESLPDCRRVLTLPSTNFYLEEVVSSMGIQVECVERDPEIYQDQLKIITSRKLNIKHTNSDIFDYIRNSDNKFDLIWLDLCGPISPYIISNFLALLQSRELISDEAYVALTILGKREHQGQEILEFYKCGSLKEFRQSKLVDLAQEFAKEAGKTCTLEDLYEYPSGSKNTPMKQYIFKTKNSQNDEQKKHSQEGSSKESSQSCSEESSSSKENYTQSQKITSRLNQCSGSKTPDRCTKSLEDNSCKSRSCNRKKSQELRQKSCQES